MAGGVDESVGVGARDAGFLRLVADVDLDEEVGAAALGLDGGGESLQQARAVDALDDVGDTDGVARLVGLQRPDEMEAKRRVGVAERREFTGCFLNAIFAEMVLTAGDDGGDIFGGVGFRHRDERDGLGRPAGGAGGGGNALLDRLQALGKGRRQRVEGIGHG